MMSILTGLILVVVLGAIVQKSDTLLDAFSDLTSEKTEEAGAAPEAVPDASGTPEETVAATPDSAEPAPPADTAAQGETGPPKVTMAPSGDAADYRAALDDVTVEAGGTYSIDVLGNDTGVRPDTYGRLVLLSAPKCGIVRLYEGRIAYFADELCKGAQVIFYCIEGADPQQCEQGVLTIHIATPSGGTLDPARYLLNDVTPNTDGIYLPDRAPRVDTSVAAPVVEEHPGALPSAKSPLALRSDALGLRGAIGLSADVGARLETPTGGLFAGNTAADAPAPVAEAEIDQPGAVALLDIETEAEPLAGPTRTTAPARDLTLSPLPVAKPAPIDRTAPEAPKISGAGVLQSLDGADAAAPSGGAASSRVKIGEASRAELLFQRADAGLPPKSRSAVAGALTAPDAAPDAAGDAPKIAALSATEIRDADAPALDRTDYASVASMVRADPGGAVAVNRIARLPGAPEPATPGPDRTPGGMQVVSVEKGAGGAGNFTLRDRATTAGDADDVQPLTSFLEKLSSTPPAGIAQGLDKATFEDPVGKAPAGDASHGEGRVDVAASGGFILRDMPAKAIPRESLVIDSGGASSETPKIAPVDTAALNRDDPANLRQNATGAEAGLRRAPADCDVALSAVGARGALVRAEAISPCRAGQVVRFAHHELEFATRFDASGRAELLLPALDRDAVVLTRTEDGREDYARATVPGMGPVSRVVLIWRAPVDLNLHAFEYGAGLGANGHVWEGSAQDIADYKRGRTGLMQAFRPIDGQGDNIEVYSFAPGRRSTAGAVDLAIEFASRGDIPAAPYCDGGAEASPRYAILRVEDGKLGAPTEGAVAPARCGVALSADARYQRGLLPEIVVSR